VQKISRRRFLGQSVCGVSVGIGASSAAAAEDNRPNILFAIADDWSWPHAGAYGAKEINTPVFDRVARAGCLFMNAFVAAPQCSPNRAATLTGRSIGQIEEAGTHGSIFPKRYSVFPDLLEEAGYHIGYTGKPWGPGDWKRGGWTRNPAGPGYNKKRIDSTLAKGISRTDYAGNFESFLEDRPKNAPFCFWYGAHEPHRGYEPGSGVKAGKQLEEVEVPKFLPDDPIVRSDILDYFVEIEWFDAQLGKMIERLDALGELDNTIVVVTSDNGMPFPRAKANLYEYGVHMPLAVQWPKGAKGGRTSDALISFVDFAPTFLEAAGVTPPSTMTGLSFLGVLTDAEDAPTRDYVITGRERHTHARFDNLGYPARAIRTQEYLYIRNCKEDRWPAGDPDQYHDIDGSPTKTFMMEKRDTYPELFEAAVGKRPAEELYDIKKDPECMVNLVGDQALASIKEDLSKKLEAVLVDQKDPRGMGTGDIFESYPRVSSMRPELGGFAERGEYNPNYQPNAAKKR